MYALERVRGLAGRIRGKLGPRGLILIYHRISDPVSNPYLLCVTPEHFEQHLRAVSEIGHPMRLEELARGVREGKLPNGAVCITFDDGYQDNLYTAKPLLERYEVPATVFMTTGRIGRTHEFWWDQLENIFLQPGHLPSRLQFDIGEQHVNWDLGQSSDYGEEDLQRDSAWTLLSEDEPTPRHAAFRALYYLLQPMGEAKRRQVLDHLLNWAGITSIVRATHRALDIEEVAQLEQGGIVEVGAHTVNHPALCEQPVHKQREEVMQSKSTLEQWLGHAVSSFAYPYGLYCDESVAVVRDAGFDYACACMGRAVRSDSDPFLLPRVDAFDWDREQFTQQLRHQLSKWAQE